MALIHDSADIEKQWGKHRRHSNIITKVSQFSFAFWTAFPLNSTGLSSNFPTECTTSSLMTHYPALSVWVSVGQRGFIQALQNWRTLDAGQTKSNQNAAHINTYRSKNTGESICQKLRYKTATPESAFHPCETRNNETKGQEKQYSSKMHVLVVMYF